MVLQAFVDDGNEILVPAPDYPLWTGAVTLSGGTPVHYLCDEENDWNPDLADIESKITENTHAPGDHQPEQPHRRGLQRGDRQGPGRHRPPARAGRLRRRDLREDPLRRRRAPPRRDRRRRRRALPDLQRAVQGLPGLRLPRRLGDDLRAQGARRRLPRGPHPARQHADVRQRAGPARDPDRARRLPVDQGADRARRPVLRAEHARRTGCSTRSPASPPSSRRARSTASRGWTPRSTAIEDDEQFVIDLLRAKKILVTHGTGFNWPSPTTSGW